MMQPASDGLLTYSVTDSLTTSQRRRSLQPLVSPAEKLNSSEREHRETFSACEAEVSPRPALIEMLILAIALNFKQFIWEAADCDSVKYIHPLLIPFIGLRAAVGATFLLANPQWPRNSFQEKRL